MVGKIGPSGSTPQKPSEEVKKNKSKTLSVGGPYFTEKLPRGNSAKEIYAKHPMPHEIKNNTGSDTKITDIAIKSISKIVSK